jgi:hypothetical protein
LSTCILICFIGQKLISHRCMRRLQSNLAYLAAIADRSHKPSSQIPAHPAFMSAPPIPSKSQPTSATTSSPQAETKKEESNDVKMPNNEDHAEILREQYKKLQALFPGVDPKKEPPLQSANSAVRAQAQQQAQAQIAAQGQKAQGDMSAQQKLQNDLMRQKMMMQQQQAQQQAAQRHAQQQEMQMGQQQQNR